MHRKKGELSRPPGADEVQMTAGFILNVCGSPALLPLILLLGENGICVARDVDDTQNSYLAVRGSIENDVVTDRKSADVRPVARIEVPANQGKLGQQAEPACNRFQVARCDFRVAALARDIEPDFVKIGSGLRREAYPHQRSDRRAVPRS